MSRAARVVELVAAAERALLLLELLERSQSETAVRLREALAAMEKDGNREARRG